MPSPRKERNDPQLRRIIGRGGDLTRSEVPDMGIKSHGHEKDNGKWKLRIDFTNINKACIRELHPLPAIEQKAEGLHKHCLKCFLDANKRLIDKVFGHKMGRNMEVNTDNMVIMSESEEEMMADINETLERLWAINLKLNPNKCSFGVEDGVYSGHLITKQGIRADPSKVKAVLTLQPPKTVSKMQNLNKKITALSRFLSKSTERTLHFMKTLRSCKSGKMVQRTKEADEAFQRIKECLESLPIMVIQTKGETLTMYLTTSKEIMSAVLMAEMGKKQIPVYFKIVTDGASSSDGAGTGLMVVSPEGKEYTYALRFAFETTNNEVEYKALLAGLCIGKEMEIRELLIFVDSQLVANQVKGLFKPENRPLNST
nr:hypothetical protein [Tanacetum cinerariifolium]